MKSTYLLIAVFISQLVLPPPPFTFWTCLGDATSVMERVYVVLDNKLSGLGVLSKELAIQRINCELQYLYA